MAKKTKETLTNLTRRERQIMDVIHRLNEAAVADVRREMPDPPSYSAVRTMIRLLESKGYLKHRRDGVRYVYRATQPVVRVRRSALKHLVRTFFNNSASEAMAALLEIEPGGLEAHELDRLRQLIEHARKKDA